MIMQFQNKIAKAVRMALVLGVGTSAIAVVPNAFAVDDEADDVERISITGSRIKRSDVESASPMTVIDAQAIAQSGVVSIEGLLQKLTAAGGQMFNSGINNDSGGNTHINLRGLGTKRTLVLVNGRRMIASGTEAAASVDLNTIPLSMIERVEVLKDGASAIYGTDAVAGVVNVILKRDFEGFEANIQTGISGEGDADATSFDFTLGASNDKANVVFGLQYTDRGDASQADRSFSDCPISERIGANGKPEKYCGGSNYAEGGHVWGDQLHGFRALDPNNPDDQYAIGESGYYGRYIDSGKVDGDGNPIAKFDYFDSNKQEADISGRGGVYHPFTDEDKFNYAEHSYLATPMQRLNLSLAGTYEINQNLLFFTEATYTKRWSKQQMAPQPIWNGEFWLYNPLSGGGVNGTNGWMTDELMPYVQTGEKVDYGRRMLDTGTRNYSQVVDTVRVVVGLEGELKNGWVWETSYNKGRNDSVYKLANVHNLGSINEAVQSGKFDPFLQTSWQGESIQPFVYTEVNSGGSELDVFAATITGDIVELPAGELAFAAGYEHRMESAYLTPDSLEAQGLANDPRVEPTAGSFKVDEVYVEFMVPLLADVFLAQNIELSAAMRYFDYSTFGDDKTWKLGLTWQIDEQFMLRGVASTAFRAPTVEELYGGEKPEFEQVQHPASDQDQAEVTTGGNPLLTPEEADIYTFGVVYESNVVEGLSVTLDYYDVDIENAINTVDDSYVANQCLGFDGSLINTDSALCQSTNIAIDSTGRITFDNRFQNLGGAATSGVDLNIQYHFAAAGLDWTINSDTSFLNEFEETDQDGNVVDFKGYITAGDGAYAEVKSNLSVTAEVDSWRVGYEMRYIDEMDSFLGKCTANPSACHSPDVDSIVYHNLTGLYHLTDSVTLSGGINNLFDETPPYFTGNNDSNTDPYTYDVIGRYFFVKAGIKF